MPEELFVQHCSPTLAGMKTANLFTIAEDDEHALLEQIAALNVRFQKAGIGVMVLGHTKKDRQLIYVYRMKKLKEDLCDPDTLDVLQNLGYETDDVGKCLTRLIQKMKDCNTFPHEIGCFLGYPGCDVKGFIENKEPYKAFGVWKVYDNVEHAVSLFARFDACTKEYISRYQSGAPLEMLSVRL